MWNELLDLTTTQGSRDFSPYCFASLGGPDAAAFTILSSTGTLALSASMADWVIEAAKKLEALGRLGAGWDSHGGLPLNQDARELAVDVLKWLGKRNLPVPGVVLGSAGTVHLEWRAKGKELEVELGPHNTIDFVKVDPRGQIEENQQCWRLPELLVDLTSWLMRDERDDEDPANGHVLICGKVTNGMAQKLKAIARWVEGRWPSRILPEF